MFTIFFRFIFILLIFALVPINNFAIAANQTYSVKQIGELPVGITHAIRSANENGDIVGTLKRGRRGQEGAVWSETAGQRDVNTTRINRDDSSASGINNGRQVVSSMNTETEQNEIAGQRNAGTRINSDYSSALGINNDKQVVGSVNIETGMRGFRSLENGNSTYLDPLPNDTSSAAIAVNSFGRVVGWSSGASGVKAVTWDESSKVKSLPNLSGSNSCRALVINDKGDIAGACDFDAGSRAVFWKKNSENDAIDLGYLPGDIWSIPTGINNKGDIVGNSGNADRHNAVLWSQNGKAIKNLGALTGRTSSRALGVNNNGDVVGYSEGVNSRDHAFIWTNKTGMQDLNELIPSGSGFVLVQAIAINSKGNISAIGYDESMNPHGHLHAEQIPLRIFIVKKR